MTAQPEPCWGKVVPGAGLAQRVPGGAAGKSWARPLRTPPRAREGCQHCQGHRLHQRVAGPWGDIKRCHPCTRSPGNQQHSLYHPAAKKAGPCHAPLGCWSCLPCGVAPQRPCHPGTWCHSRPWAMHGPTASPWRPVPCLLPSPAPEGGGCGGMRSQCSLGKSQHQWIPPLNQTRGAHHFGRMRTSLQIFEQFIVPGLCTKT